MPFCRNCGTGISSSAKFCSECGHSVATDERHGDTRDEAVLSPEEFAGIQADLLSDLREVGVKNRHNNYMDAVLNILFAKQKDGSYLILEEPLDFRMVGAYGQGLIDQSLLMVTDQGIYLFGFQATFFFFARSYPYKSIASVSCNIGGPRSYVEVALNKYGQGQDGTPLQLSAYDNQELYRLLLPHIG